MNNNSSNNKGMKDTPKLWNDTEVKLLKKWGEQAASYRVLHNRAYRKYKTLTALFTIPVIIISTLTGTANFSQGTIIQIYPSFDIYLPLVIGALNLISGIVTTIGQFLRVSELNEANRNASISYGKFARNISTELSLPPNERTYSGLDYIQICRNEMDRLIEQSPEISMKIISKFERNKKFKHIIKPELINISEIEVYQPSKEEKAKEIVAGAAGKFRNKFLTNKLTELEPTKDSTSKFKEFNAKRNVELELSEIRENSILKNENAIRKVSSIFEKKDDTHVVDMNKVKNIFESNTPVPSRSKLGPRPKITSLADLVTKDNLNLIKNEMIENEMIEKQNEQNNEKIEVMTLEEEEIDTDKTKKILNKLDIVKNNIENNINIDNTIKILNNVEKNITSNHNEDNDNNENNEDNITNQVVEEIIQDGENNGNGDTIIKNVESHIESLVEKVNNQNEQTDL